MARPLSFMGLENFHQMVKIVIEDYPALEPERNPTRFHLKYRWISSDSRTRIGFFSTKGTETILEGCPNFALERRRNPTRLDNLQGPFIPIIGFSHFGPYNRNISIHRIFRSNMLDFVPILTIIQNLS